MVRYAQFIEYERNGMPLFVNLRRLTQNPNRRYEIPASYERNVINRGPSRPTTFENVAAQIVLAVQQAVRIYNRMTARDSLTRVSGWLQATNRLTGNDLGEEPIPIPSLGNLTGAQMEAYIATIQSAEEVDFEDIDWRFVIDPNSILVGGAPKVKRPSYASNRVFAKTWEGYEGVNCAAYAINYALQHPKKVRDITLIKQAKTLQEKLGWDLEITPNEILRTFPKHFPDYLIVIINPLVASLGLNSPGYRYDRESGKVIYLVFDPIIKHYGATLHPHSIWQKTTNSGIIICGPCNVVFPQNREHVCENGGKHREKKLKIKHPCESCGKFRDVKHDCSVIQCKNCSYKYPRGETTHRCFVFEEDKEKRFNTDGLLDPEGVDSAMTGDGSLPCCFAYDIESRVDIRTEVIHRVACFKKSDDDPDMFKVYKESLEEIVIKNMTSRYQQPNWIGIKNIYNNKFYSFTGIDCLHECLNFLLCYNRGNNQMWAHNAAGYDTRLIYDVACHIMGDTKIASVERGTKFMILTINKTRNGALIFYDSLNHLKGTLAGLAKDFFPDDPSDPAYLPSRKGDFPHFFNTAENWDNDYKGIIPSLEEFDIPFKSGKKDKEGNCPIEAFKAWHKEWSDGYLNSSGKTHVWNFREELIAYAENDVHILAQLLRLYNDIGFEKFGMMPLFHATCAGYMSHVAKVQQTNLLEFASVPEDLKESRRLEIAWTEGWGNLKPFEYWQAQRTLRGGRTNIGAVFFELSPEEIARGDRIAYVDVVSMYPAMQVIKKYPSGLPEIRVYDPQYTPCSIHQSNTIEPCNCSHPRLHSFLKVTNHPQPSQQEFLAYLKDPDYCGFLCVSLSPPKNLWHPIICFHDPLQKKTLFSNQELFKTNTTSIELITALENGYTLIKVYTFHRYNYKESVWRDLTRELIIEKTINSKALPPPEKCEALVEEYREFIGADFADHLQRTITEKLWGKRPAKKQTFKTCANVIWGKNAQRPILPKSFIFNLDEPQAYLDFFTEISSGRLTFNSGQITGKKVKYKATENGAKVDVDLSKGYMPAASFVTSHARLYIWEQLNLIDQDPEDRRVLMTDTDSIIYIKRAGKYNVPTGKALGKWEVEDADAEHGGLTKFVALGPKSYSFECADGYSVTKAKGISLKYGHRDMVNYNTMKEIILARQENQNSKIIPVPQWSFVYKCGDGMRQHFALKKLQFNHDEMKGDLETIGRAGVPRNFIAPFGFETSDRKTIKRFLEKNLKFV